MKHPLVSIVTSTYNSEKTVRKAIESVLSQTYDRIEYIISDGASSDNTLEIAKEYADKFKEKGYIYKIISSPDNGIYSGMNKGIAQTTGDIVGMVNSDDWYENNIAEVMAKKFEETDFDMCYGQVYLVSKTGDKSIKPAKRMRHFFTSRKWNHPTTFIRRGIYDFKKYDETYKYYADWDMILWIYKHYDNIHVIDKPLAYFRLGGATTSNINEAAKKKLRERYNAYIDNDYSKIYIIECVLMEVTKNNILKIINKKG